MSVGSWAEYLYAAGVAHRISIAPDNMLLLKLIFAVTETFAPTSSASPGANQAVSKRQLERKYRVARDNNESAVKRGKDNIIRTAFGPRRSNFCLFSFRARSLA